MRGRPCLAQRALYKQRRVPAASASPAIAIPVAPEAARARGDSLSPALRREQRPPVRPYAPGVSPGCRRHP